MNFSNRDSIPDFSDFKLDLGCLSQTPEPSTSLIPPVRPSTSSSAWSLVTRNVPSSDEPRASLNPSRPSSAPSASATKESQGRSRRSSSHTDESGRISQFFHRKEQTLPRASKRHTAPSPLKEELYVSSDGPFSAYAPAVRVPTPTSPLSPPARSLSPKLPEIGGLADMVSQPAWDTLIKSVLDVSFVDEGDASESYQHSPAPFSSHSLPGQSDVSLESPLESSSSPVAISSLSPEKIPLPPSIKDSFDSQRGSADSLVLHSHPLNPADAPHPTPSGSRFAEGLESPQPSVAVIKEDEGASGDKHARPRSKSVLSRISGINRATKEESSSAASRLLQVPRKRRNSDGNEGKKGKKLWRSLSGKWQQVASALGN
ncbi:hypothetical protein DL96DRAFT_1621835, partial [Flagelloscypha sp. PMI_526]